MRSLCNSLATMLVLGLAPTLAHAQITPSDLLDKFRPFLGGFEYDTPTEKEAIEACKIETVHDAQNKPIGYALRDGQGKLLRKFVDSNGQRDAKGQTHLDQWSYYQNGFEVYREVDLDEDGSLDECRFLNAGGTRTAIIKDRHVVGWKRISAEEASKVLVQGLISGDQGLIETLMATPAELSTLGVPKGMTDEVAKKSADRATELKALRDGLVGWDGQTVWQRFDGMMPHVIPAEAGVKEDLTLYENAFIFAGQPNGQGDPMKVAYLQVPELIKIGETWKFVELPVPVNPAKPVAPVADAGLRSWLYRENLGPDVAPQAPELVEALKALAEHDEKNAPGPEATKQQIAQYHFTRVNLLKPVLELATSDEEKQNYTRQIVDSLAATYQTGQYAKGADVLDRYTQQEGPVASYAAYRKILAEYSLAADQPGAQFFVIQKEFLGKLDDFITKFPKSDEAPEVLLQLASVNEFNAEEEEARRYYEQLAQSYPETDPGKKALGALKRLDLVGKSIDLSGQGLQGKPLQAADYRGKHLLIVFWTSDAGPVRQDLPELMKVYQKYQPKGFDILGVNLDADRKSAEAFLTENQLPWAQIWEEGGMDSRLANEYGVFTLPTMILVDPKGVVVNRNIRTSSDLEKFLNNVLAEGGEKLTLGAK